MSVENKTEIELLRILYQNSKENPTKNLTFKRAYPIGIENKYYYKLRAYFKPLFDFVNKYIKENGKDILKGDSKNVRMDNIPGDSFDDMIYSLENWIDVYMPDLSQSDDSRLRNTIYVGLNQTAEEVKKFNDKEFSDSMVKAIHVNLPTNADWWGKMLKSWSDSNYSLITSNARNYVSKINNLVENAVVNGQGMLKLKEEIEKATRGLSEAHCRLIARDQIGKLNGLINQAQMEEIGLKLYVWDTSMDERVRDSHRPMQGLLCRWDNARVCSYDGGKSWVERPSGAVQLHPGQDFQCRCSALVYNPELIAQLEGKPMEIVPADQLAREVILSQSKELMLYNPSLVSNSWKISPVLPEEAKDIQGLYALSGEAKQEFIENTRAIISSVKNIVPLFVEEGRRKTEGEIKNYLLNKQKDYENHGGTYSRFYNKETGEYDTRYVDNVLQTLVLFGTLMELQRVLLAFLDDDSTVRVKNNFAMENPVGYGNVVVNSKLPNGLIAEVELGVVSDFIAYGYGSVLNDIYRLVCHDAEFISFSGSLKKTQKKLYSYSTELSDGDFPDVDDVFDFDYAPYEKLIKEDIKNMIPDYKKALEKGLIDKKTDERFRKLCERIGVKI